MVVHQLAYADSMETKKYMASVSGVWVRKLKVWDPGCVPAYMAFGSCGTAPVITSYDKRVCESRQTFWKKEARVRNQS